MSSSRATRGSARGSGAPNPGTPTGAGSTGSGATGSTGIGGSAGAAPSVTMDAAQFQALLQAVRPTPAPQPAPAPAPAQVARTQAPIFALTPGLPRPFVAKFA